MTSIVSKRPGADARRPLTAERIRAAAAEVFAERGFAATTLQDIGEHLGTGRTALYHYVASKDDLFVALVEDVAAQARAALAEGTRGGCDAPEQLDGAVRALVAFTVERPRLVRLLETAPNTLPPAAAASLRRHNRGFFRDFIAVVRRGVDDGTFRPVDPDVAAHAIAGMIRSFSWWYHPGGPQSLESITDQLAASVVRGLIADGPRLPRVAVSQALSRIESDLGRIRGIVEAS